MTPLQSFALAALLALMLAAPAVSKATEMPKEFRGGWCGPPSGEGPYTRSRRNGCPDASGDDQMGVDTTGFEIGDHYCRAINIKPQGRRFQITFECSGGEGKEPWSYTLENIWELVGGKLWVR